MSSSRRKIVTEEPAKEGTESPHEERGREKPEYFGWVYHLGVNSIGHEFCHLRFLLIRGKYVEVYKRDPHENHGIKPIRKGIVGPTFMVEELGRRKFNHGDLYVLRFYNRLDETKKGQIACATAGEARTWMEAFDYAKQQAEYELSRSKSVREKLNMEAEINLDVHRPRVRRYALGLRKLIKIGQGPEKLLRQSSKVGVGVRSNGLSKGDGGDAIEAHEWKCVQTINGIRLFEDVSDTKGTKCALVKAVGVIDAGADVVFDVILDLEKQRRYEWDMLTGDLELLDSYDGHYDVVYATCDPKYLTGWHSKKDFVFSRQWFCGQDGTYTILQLPAFQKKRPQRSGYLRTKINPSTWEIRNLEVCVSGGRCLVTHMLEIPSEGWCRWKKNNYSKFEKTIPFALLCQVAGLKEYIKANPVLKWDASATVIDSKHPEYPVSGEMEDGDVHEEFYDAMAAGTSSSSSDDDDSDDEEDKGDDGKQDRKVRLKNVSWAITSLALKRESGTRDTDKELDASVPATSLDSRYGGTVKEARDETEANCWSCPSGTGFMIRGKSYLRDNSKIRGGDPLLKLIAVDWFKLDKCSSDQVSLHPNSLPQSDAGRKLPFLLVINLQVPAKPNYSLVLYYASERPVRKGSSLAKFVDGNDLYRDSRFKLIPSIVEGYWMVKRAVGTKACLLGKAVTCRYFRQDNFLEVDVDIGSSSVARSVIGLVLGYISSIVVDLAIVIEAKEEADLPEFILGTARLKRIRLDSAVLL